MSILRDKLYEFNNKYHNIVLILISLLVAFLTGILSDQVTSFIYLNALGTSYVNDPNMFYYMGKLFISGYKPYYGFFDHKGPFIFYFTGIANLLGGRFGMILLHTIVFGIFYYFLFKIYDEYKMNSSIRILITSFIFSLIVICGQSPFDAEPIYPLISMCMYYYIKAINSGDDKYYMIGNILCGVFAGMAIHLRAMEAIIPLALVIYYGIINLKNKKYKNIIINALLCISGLIIISLIPLIHSIIGGFTGIMYKSIIIDNFSYASGFWSGVDIYRLTSRITIIGIELLVIILLVLVKWKKKINNVELLFYSSVISIILFVEFITAYYMHYLLSVFPIIFIFIGRILSLININKYIRVGIITVSMVIGVISSMIFPIYNYKNVVYKNNYINEYINNVVGENDKNYILVYQSSASIYINNNILVSYPDFACQNNHIRISSYYTFDKLVEYAKSDKCKYIICDNYIYDEFISYIVNNGLYTLVSSDLDGSKYINIYTKC